MEPRAQGQTQPDSNTDSTGPKPGSRHNFRATPRGYLVANCIAAHPRLSPNAKLMWGVIRSMGYKDGYCYATDEELAARIGVEPDSVRKLILELKREGFVEVTRRTGRPSMRYLLWQECFASDQKGGENPGPDSDLYPPGYAEFVEPGERAKEPGSTRDTAQLNAQSVAFYPNYLSSRSSSRLSNNNSDFSTGPKASETTPAGPVVVAQKRVPKSAPEKPGETDQRVSELVARGVLAITARRVAENLPADFPLVDALDFYEHKAKSPGSRIRNVPGFMVTLLEGGILPPATWETRALRAAREKAEREQAELDARQMDFDLQLETELDAEADTAVKQLQTAEPEKFAALVKQAKAELLMRPPGPAMPPEFTSNNLRFDAVARTQVWKSIRQDLYLARLASSPGARGVQL